MRTGRRGGPVVLLAALVLALTGCGLPGPGLGFGDDDPTPSLTSPTTVPPKASLPPGQPLDDQARIPDPPTADGQDATDVARSWVTTAYRYDTAYDTSPQDAILRANRYATEAKAAAEREYRPAADPGARWNRWAAHEAWTTVAVTLHSDGDAPADTATTAYREFSVDGTAHGRDGWTGTGPRLTVYVELVREGGAGGSWRVTDVTTVEAVAPPSPPDDPTEGTGPTSSAPPTDPTESTAPAEPSE
jgi:predicted small lipoprotein YifL